MKARLLALAVSAALVPHAYAATFEVTRTDDPAPNGCQPEDCSLREAVLAANLLPDSTVNLPAGTYRLSIVRGEADPDDGTKGNLVIAAPMTLAGAGMDLTIVDARPDDGEATPGVDRVLTILRQGAPVTVTGLTLTGGYLDPENIFAGQGGCLLIRGGSAALTDVRVTGCF
ncbi:MAG: hypothetical protein K8I02_03760, partial [Candidatus Methylomirabilis sp.]|nr:hypothetical protein [Deltaproteobacteria bacterium]